MPEISNFENFEKQPYSPEIVAPTVATEPISWLGLLGTVLIFIIILFVALLIIKKLNRFSVKQMDSSWVRVLDRQILGGQQVLYLVEIAGKIQVLGTTEHHITKVAEINDPVIAAEILEEIAERPEERMDKFMNSIWRNIRSRKKKERFSSELEQLLEEVKK